MQIRTAIKVLATLSLAVVALAAATPGAKPPTVFIAGRAYGLGEQQVYAIWAHAKLVVGYRNAEDEIVSKTIELDQRRSVALTVEGYSSAGEAVLAAATAAPTSSASATPANPAPAAPQARPTLSPPPSPSVAANGALADAGPLKDLAPLSMIVSGLGDQAPELGKTWNSQGKLRLPIGDLNVRFKNEANSSSGDENSTVLVVTSSGTAEASGKVKVPAFGFVTLRGALPASATSYVELNNRLLLGTTMTASGRGNVAGVHGRRGTFDVKVDYVVKLAKLVAGSSPPPVAGSAAPPYGSLGTPNTSIFGPAPVSSVAYPAPVDTEYQPSPLPVTASPSPLPEVSLPPIPIALPSDQPIASPPLAPSPSPT